MIPRKPSIAAVPSTDWPVTGSLPPAYAIPATNPSGAALTPLVVSVRPSAGYPANTALFQSAAIGPTPVGGTPIERGDYAFFLRNESWIYLPTPNKVLKLGPAVRVSDTAFYMPVIEGDIPAGPALPGYTAEVVRVVATPFVWRLSVATGTITVNGAALVPPMDIQSPLAGGGVQAVAYDATGATGAIEYTS